MEQTTSKIQRRGTLKNDFQQTYFKLNTFIEKLNEKIVNRIQLVQHIYVEDYKAQVKEMAEELSGIRAVLDEQLLKQRSNERLFFLEEERDFFRGQVVKLNEELTGLARSNEKLKYALEEKTAEAKNYKTLAYQLRRKIAKVQNEAFEMEKIRQSVPIPSLVQEKRESISLSPTKTSLTRYSPALIHTDRTGFKSVELRNHKETPVDNELRRKEQILEQCIKDQKKKIFYRTLDERNSGKFHFDEVKSVPFERFTRSDREELIRGILTSDQILGQFYQFMIGKKDKQQERSLTRLQGSKTTFSDKIFKIKLCGISK